MGKYHLAGGARAQKYAVMSLPNDIEKPGIGVVTMHNGTDWILQQEQITQIKFAFSGFC